MGPAELARNRDSGHLVEDDKECVPNKKEELCQ